MKGLKYPLEQLLRIKKNRYDQALKTLEEKKALLEEEKKTLQKREAERDRVLQHKQEKLRKLREELDQGTTSDKVETSKHYLKVVEEELSQEEKKVEKQKQNVKNGEKQVELAKEDLFQKKKDLEKLEIHQKEWEKEVKLWSTQQEAIEHDELGSATYSLRKKGLPKKKPS